MSNDMLQNIEYLREKANVSYEEAAQLLEQFDGNVMSAIVELERQGRLFSQGSDGNAQTGSAEQWQKDANEAKAKAESFFQKMSKTHVVITKKGKNGEREAIADVSAPIAAGVTLFAPYVTLATAAIGFISGYQVNVEQPDDEK